MPLKVEAPHLCNREHPQLDQPSALNDYHGFFVRTGADGSSSKVFHPAIDIAKNFFEQQHFTDTNDLECVD